MMAIVEFLAIVVGSLLLLDGLCHVLVLLFPALQDRADEQSREEAAHNEEC